MDDRNLDFEIILNYSDLTFRENYLDNTSIKKSSELETLKVENQLLKTHIQKLTNENNILTSNNSILNKENETLKQNNKILQLKLNGFQNKNNNFKTFYLKYPIGLAQSFNFKM